MQSGLNILKFNISTRVLALTVFLFLGYTTIAQQATTYDEAIKYGDQLLKKSELLNAKAYFQQALKIKPGDKYAKEKISLIVEKMKSSMAAEDEFYDIIDYADELYDKNKLNDAIDQYKKALKIIPDDEYALSKIREITEFQNSEKEKIESFDKAMEAGKYYISNKEYDNAIASFREAAGIFPDKDSPITELNNANNLKSEEEQKEVIFNQKLEDAERYLLIKNYVEALVLYKEADLILSSNEAAKTKIAELTPLANKQKEYNIQVNKADDFYIAKDFISARKQYLVAKDVWTEKSYPTDMIEKIDDKLKDERKNLEKNYSNYLGGGDSLMEHKEYSQALGKYNLALNLKPDADYPKSKVLEIETIFGELLKAAEANYSSMILSADSAFNSGLLNIARDKYQTALEVKPEDEYPKNQLIKIESRIEAIATQDKLDNDYNELIRQADKLHNTGNYDLAIKKYQEAQALKSMESYPQAKIDAITLALADAEKQKQIDEKYNELIVIAVRQFSQDNLDEARISYTNAMELKPYEVLPQMEINKIDSFNYN